jgi:hypothetical protein
MRGKEGWQPYEGDGIDVPIRVKGTTVTFDIALVSPDRCRILLGECKAWADALEQDHIFTLFGKIIAVASETKAAVEGVLFASGGFDPGPMRAAPQLRIRIFEVRKGQPRHAFTLAEPHLDEVSGQVVREWGVGIGEENIARDSTQSGLHAPPGT